MTGHEVTETYLFVFGGLLGILMFVIVPLALLLNWLEERNAPFWVTVALMVAILSALLTGGVALIASEGM